jgi:serine-type D-Ala-D-Ala endopeptidase (penicillin-binding protein 7)
MSGKVTKLLASLCCCALGLTLMSVEASAATTKKKVVVESKKVVKHARHKTPIKKIAKRSTPTHLARVEEAPGLRLASSAVLVQDQVSGDVLVDKNSAMVQPIASITKVMTAMVVLDAQPNLQEMLTIGQDDVDQLKGTGSRLRVGAQLTREEMLRLALMSSENRAASALSRHYPGGKVAFINAMNRKSENLGLVNTRFRDPTGLTAENVSTPRDLARMVSAAYQYPLIREFSTTPGDTVMVAGREMQFNNTNALVKSPNWDIGLSKTGYIAEAGKCLVMQAWLNSKPVVIVLLDSWGKTTRIGDANRIKQWMESSSLTQNRRPAV